MIRKEEVILFWENWTIKHGRTPKRHSKDIEEDRLAANTSRIYSVMKKDPVKYKELIARYEETYYAYNSGKYLRGNYLDVFNEWKTWVLKNGKLPSSNCENNAERSIAFRIKTAVKNMQKESFKYVKELQEYEEIISNPDLDIIHYNFKVLFEEWKAWCELYKRIPKNNKNNEAERHLYKRISSRIYKMRKEPEKYECYLREYEDICKKYGCIKMPRVSKKHFFEIWKKWCIANNRTPSRKSIDRYEAVLGNRIYSYIYCMKKDPDKYSEELKAYEDIRTKYSSYKNKLSTFYEWKEWVEINYRLPTAESEDKYERSLCARIHSCLQRMRKEEKLYSLQIAEYNEVYRKHTKKKLCEDTFEEWKQWVIKNLRLPKKQSSDNYEASLNKRMSCLIYRLRKIPDEYHNIIKEYEAMCDKYGVKKTGEDTFKMWKQWIKTHGKKPNRNSSDINERRLHFRMRSYLSKWNKDKKKYRAFLMEYKKICESIK